MDADTGPGTALFPAPPRSPRLALFAVSAGLLFAELAFVRWFPAHVVFLAFFANTVLLASFLGMSAGCLAADSPRRLIRGTPALLALALGIGAVAELAGRWLERHVDVGQTDPQVIYFGAEYFAGDVARLPVPVELVIALVFGLTALAFVGPGQELGRAFGRVPGRLTAYTLNVAGSLTGVGLFAACAWLELPPAAWFVPVVVGVGWLTHQASQASGRTVALLAVALVSASVTSGPGHFWSPYSRVDADARGVVRVNRISHQQMRACAEPYPAYALPHLLRRDAGVAPFRRALLVGCGTGNDLARALQFAAPDARIDAVEIDPAILRLGRRHPDRPYDDPRVTVTLDDGRHFLRNAPADEYDLVIFGMIDSLALQSGQGSLRLESWLFTEESLADARRCLKADGTFVVYNHFRQGWLVGRLQSMLFYEFHGHPLALTLPGRKVLAEYDSFDGFTLLMAGNIGPIRDAFDRAGVYRLPASPGPDAPNGFTATTGEAIPRTSVDWPDRNGVEAATDDWPFLYAAGPSLPGLTVRGSLLLALVSVALLWWASRQASQASGGRQPSESSARDTEGLRPPLAWPLAVELFALGAGFMLIEAKAVVQLSLLFGGTWAVNTVVIAAVLVTVLLANLTAILVRPTRRWPWYVGVGVALLAGVWVSPAAWVGLPWVVRTTLACGLTFAPVYFAGVVFAAAFGKVTDPARALAANTAGAVLGGLAENLSLMLGFRLLGWVAVACYVAAWMAGSVRAVRAARLAEPAGVRRAA